MKRNTLLIFAAILLVGGSFVFAEYKNKQADQVYSSNVIETIDTSDESSADIDTDEDGSMDWEEILVGTNPNDPKSKPSTSKAPVTADLTKEQSEKLSQIDLISRDFFARYMELRQMGGSTEKNNQDDLALRTASGIVLSAPAEYKLSEILTKTDDSKEAVIAYGNQISSIFKKYVITTRNEAVIAKDALEQEDSEILKELDPIITSYKNIINSLVKISVPQSAAKIHLDLINAMNGSLFLAQSFRSADVDAIKAMQGVSYYQTSVENLSSSVFALKSYLKSLGIDENIF